MDEIKTSALPREIIGQFIKNPRAVRAFEGLQDDTVNIYEAITSARFLTLSNDPNLGQERIFAPVAGELAGSDGGVGGDYTLGLADTTVVPGAYGDEAKTLALTVDAKGRIAAAEAFDLNTDNVTEGIVNLFFTVERARESLAGGTGIAYNPATGVIDLDASGVVAGTYASPTSITVDAYGRITAIS